MATWVSVASATPVLSMAAGAAPVFFMELQVPMAPASICSPCSGGLAGVALPRKPRFMGKASAASQHALDARARARRWWQGTVVVGRRRRSKCVVMLLASVLLDLLLRQMKWMAVKPPAVTMCPSQR